MPKATEITGLSMLGLHGNMVGVSWRNPANERFHVWLQIERGEPAQGRPSGLPGLPVMPYTVRDEQLTAGRNAGQLAMGARYRFQLYKNPPLNPDGTHKNSRDPGYFATRHLDANAKAHAATVQHALREAERLGLYQLAIDAAAAEEAARVDAAQQEAADTMLHAAQQLVDEGLPGAEQFAAQVRDLSRDQQARMLWLIQNASHSRKAVHG
jgi:hypothetical protein